MKQPDMFHKDDVNGYACDDDNDADDIVDESMIQWVQLLLLFKSNKQERQPDSQRIIFLIQWEQWYIIILN